MNFGNTTIYQVIEFSGFFPGEKINIRETLKRFSKEKLVDAVSVMSMNFGNSYIPNDDMTFFSRVSSRHIADLNSRAEDYLNRLHNNSNARAYYCTYRSTLELLRYMYSIPYDEYCGDIAAEDYEYELFRVMTAINEELYNDIIDTDDLAEIELYMEYAMNDMNMADIGDTMRTQAYYCMMLFDFLETSSKAGDLYQKFLYEYGIVSWKEYVATIQCLIFHMKMCIKNKEKGNPSFSFDALPIGMKDRISLSVIEKISINIDDYVAFDAEDNKDRDNNVDYRRFRSCPLVKTKDGFFHPINFQMICELIYNSLFFVLNNFYKGNFFSFYNKRFVEEYLFHRSMLKICDGNGRVKRYIPEKKDILSAEIMKEEDNQPDFYARINSDLFIFECKAFKLNGTFKEKGKIKPLINEFYKKVVHSLNKKGQDEDFAVRQLIKHIANIDSYNFKWDEDIPDEVVYYPVIIFEDPKLANVGAAVKIQDWNNEELWKIEDPNEAYMPIVTMSIDTLFIYWDVFRKIGFDRVLKGYIKECAKFDHSKGWILSLDKSFNQYIQRYGYRRKGYYDTFIQEVLRV